MGLQELRGAHQRKYYPWRRGPLMPRRGTQHRKARSMFTASTVPVAPEPSPWKGGVSAEDHVTDLVTECNRHCPAVRPSSA